MKTLNIQISDGKLERLKLPAQTQSVTLNKLVEAWAGIRLMQFHVEVRLRARAARGRTKRRLDLLDKLNHAFGAARAEKRSG